MIDTGENKMNLLSLLLGDIKRIFSWNVYKNIYKK